MTRLRKGFDLESFAIGGLDDIGLPQIVLGNEAPSAR